MAKNKIKQKISILIFLLLAMPIVSAQTQSAGMTPDSPLYFLDELFDNVRYSFSRGQRKAEVGLEIAQERIQEMKQMSEKNMEKGLERARNNYNRIVNKVQQQTGLNQETRERISENLQKHVETLEGVLEDAPEQAKQGLQIAIENSQRVTDRIKSQLPIIR